MANLVLVGYAALPDLITGGLAEGGKDDPLVTARS